MGNFIQKVKSCFRPKQEEYASFINPDNLLLDNIQERINQHDNRTYTIEENIAKLKIPILVLSEMYVINPTTSGPNNAANFPSMLYRPKYSQSLPFGINVE